ncbi:flagellar filament capping protein FliD [Microbacterium sp. 77mftsu3.1]|uniref:flagellar filament capping protein FliD n=1 Tax=Microbacterium sp. 77mftsu3.1 TaxID=1761802 RepID=UPI00035FA806|nr:flagellar filament capping protein FliD [Microbacterium sp. 77mftsu3.1]SDH36829.1 flagellar hook-associated protein 2 [Microbacterium sp. 77mftsu3.1]
MGIQFDGLASGLKTGEIIDALMNVQKIPRNMLSAKTTEKQTLITQFQSLNTSLQNLFETSKKNTGADALAQMQTSSSNEAVKVTAKAGTASSATSVQVDKTAAAHSIVTAAVKDFGEQLGFTIRNSKGELTELAPTSSSPQDLARAINAAGAGVKASAIAAGKDADGNNLYRLQVTAEETGTASEFTLFAGDSLAVGADGGTDLAAAVVTEGRDAQVRLWAGTDAEQVVTSKTNTFTDLLPGVDITISKVPDAAVDITVATDTAARTTAAETYVKQIQALMTGLANGSKATTATAPGETTRLGVFTGDSTIRQLRTSLANAVQYPVDGVSPSTIGISFDKFGALQFDKEKFTAAIEKDPAAVDKVFKGISSRVQGVADDYSDKYDGLITSKITGQETEVRAMKKQVESWDVRLEQRKASLQRTYSSLETMMSRMQSQSGFLSAQMNSLPANSRN